VEFYSQRDENLIAMTAENFRTRAGLMSSKKKFFISSQEYNPVENQIRQTHLVTIAYPPSN